MNTIKYPNIREEELKNQVGSDYFGDFNTNKIIGNVDFCVTDMTLDLFEPQSLLWAEAKKDKSNIYHSLSQLILTIGKARTFDKVLPPAFLGAFDGGQIAFIPYHSIQEIFYQNDFNWRVTPSDYKTREFQLILESVTSIIKNESLIFTFGQDDKEIHKFIKANFVVGKSGLSKIPITKNNFVTVYSKWLNTVKPSILVDWVSAKKSGIIDADFYLADLLSKENQSLKENLYVFLRLDHYELAKKMEDSGLESTSRANYFDNQKAHQQFWNKYERPPREEYRDYIVKRRDLLVPQDVRERKGSFFTPQIWVEKSQEYLADVLGENWQDEYYIWDCAAGTGNLLTGLTNPTRIYASTLDQADVSVMQDRIQNGAKLLPNHCFQFDFLNDEFTKLPKGLQAIVNDPELRKKLVIYINPPYAEASSATTVTQTGNNKTGVAIGNKTYLKYKEKLGNASNELFTQFFARINFELFGCYLSSFSTLKYTQSSNFVKFRQSFLAEFKSGFIVPGDTFDNVKGRFPIGFLIWDTSKKKKFEDITIDVFNSQNLKLDTKVIHSYDDIKGKIVDWYKLFYDKSGTEIGIFNTRGNDFQNQNYIHISTTNNFNHTNLITKNNVIPTSIYFAIRHVFKATWLNDRDQFLYPNDGWLKDTEFQNDCLIYTLFHGQNRITSKDGINNWIPFTETQVGAPERFGSNFMTNFMSGRLGEVIKLPTEKSEESDSGELFTDDSKPNIVPTSPLEFSPEAKKVLGAGEALWRYYYKQVNPNPNASFYDIKEHFQGRKENGHMKSSSEDQDYNNLHNALKLAQKALEAKIQPKVYEYGFLK